MLTKYDLIAVHKGDFLINIDSTALIVLLKNICGWADSFCDGNERTQSEFLAGCST